MKQFMKLISILLVLTTVLPLFTVPINAASPVASVSEIPTDGWLWPAPPDNQISSGYNLSKNGELNFLKDSRKASGVSHIDHGGIDIAGTFTVMAARAGKVVQVQKTGSNNGTTCIVVLEHTLPNGKVCYSRYLHFASGTIKVKLNETVKAGQPLGTSGNTGPSYGNHLHFEITTSINPKNNTNSKLNVNPKRSLGIKTQYGKRTINKRTYTKSDFESVLFDHSIINYSLSSSEAEDIIAYSMNSKSCSNIILSCTSSSSVKFYDTPSTYGKPVSRSNIKGKYFHASFAAVNAHGKRMFRIDDCDDTSLIGYYITSSDFREETIQLSVSYDKKYYITVSTSKASSNEIIIVDQTYKTVSTKTFKSASVKTPGIKGHTYLVKARVSYKIGKRTYHLSASKALIVK
ncbi:MAG: M23 family metallopeptidase [Clostridia bacterium]|nr:M23 family metallopeptidase [Clostridia bacterium]